MAATTTLCTSYLKDILEGTHDAADTYKIALIKETPSGTYGAGTENYSDLTDNSDEVANGNGYTTGGVTLSGFTTGISGSIAYLDWTTDPAWNSSTFSTVGAIIYNSSKSNKALCVLDFDGVFSPSNGTFTITFPAPGATALIRLS